MKVIKTIKKVLGHKELRWFWRYAVMANLHIGRYASKKIILVRLDMIGDCTMFSSAAKAICDYYKDREVTVVCLSTTKPVFERMSCFTEIIPVDFKPTAIEYPKLKSLIRQLRSTEYDLLLQPQASKLPIADIIDAAIKCNRRIALETKVGNSSARWISMVNFLYDEFIPLPKGNVSEFDYYGAFVRGLGCPDYKTTCPSLPYHEQHFIEGNYYVLYPAGSFRQKFWPLDRVAQLADHIYQKTGFIAVILGAPHEKWVAEEIKAKLHPLTAMSTINLMGRTTIEDVIDIIGNAQFVISNDTSGVHIACATKTPSVVVVGGWHFRRFLPYHIENPASDDCLPVSAYTEMPCYYCDWDWNTIGKRNPECLRRMQCEEPCMCIDAVRYEQVCELVDEMIERARLC